VTNELASQDNVYAPPRTRAEALEPEVLEPVFFPCGTTKLVVMSVFTLGCYQYYWHYRNWKCAAKLLGRSYWSPVRALFFPITSYFLFKKIESEGTRHDVHLSMWPGFLALAIFFMNGLQRLPDPWWLTYLFAFLPMLPVQRAVNGINAKLAPEADRNTRFGPLNILFALVGALILALVVIAFVTPDDAQ
jgi:hypothetical protein